MNASGQLALSRVVPGAGTCAAGRAGLLGRGAPCAEGAGHLGRPFAAEASSSRTTASLASWPRCAWRSRSATLALAGIEPGMTVEFTLVVTSEATYAEAIRIVRTRPSSRIRSPHGGCGCWSRRPTRHLGFSSLAVGRPVPDFTLTDQPRRVVTLSTLRGKVVAINFVYTSCALPQFCFRTANHFGALQRRFKDAAGGRSGDADGDVRPCAGYARGPGGVRQHVERRCAGAGAS